VITISLYPWIYFLPCYIWLHLFHICPHYFFSLSFVQYLIFRLFSTPFAHQQFGWLSGPPSTFRIILLLFSADMLSPAPFQADIFSVFLSPFLGNISFKRHASFLLLMEVFNLVYKGSWNCLAEICCFLEITPFRHCYCSQWDLHSMPRSKKGKAVPVTGRGGP
jgi:hypothetical protein